MRYSRLPVVPPPGAHVIVEVKKAYSGEREGTVYSRGGAAPAPAETLSAAMALQVGWDIALRSVAPMYVRASDR